MLSISALQTQLKKKFYNIKGVDAYYTSSYDILPPAGIKLIGVVHDIIPKVLPEVHTKDAADRLEATLQPFLTRADRVIVDSESTKRDLLKHFDLPPDKATVVYAGVDEQYCPPEGPSKTLYKHLENQYNIYSNYILYIGTIEPRKNIKGLIQAYQLLRTKGNTSQKLVIAGMKGWMYDEVYALTESLDLAKEVIFTGYVPQEDINTLYGLADVFVYPSLYEGAGLPVLEAFACATPVVCSNVSSIPEMAGDAACLVDPRQPAQIAEAIERVLADAGLRQQMIEKGMQRAKEFSWDRTARQTLEIILQTS